MPSSTSTTAARPRGAAPDGTPRRGARAGAPVRDREDGLNPGREEPARQGRRPALVSSRTAHEPGGAVDEAHPPRPENWRGGYVTRMRVVDALAIAMTMIAAQLVRFGGGPDGADQLQVGGLSIHYLLVGIALGLAWWAWLELRGTRAVRLIGYGMDESRQVLAATLTLYGAVAIVAYALALPVARGYVLVALPVGLVLIASGRWMMRSLLIRRRRRGEALARTLVVGRACGALETVESLRQHVEAGLEPVAAYYPRGRTPVPRQLCEIDVPNALADGERPSVTGILDSVRDRGIETLVLTGGSPLTSTEIRHLSWYLADAHVRLIMNTGLTDVAGPRIHTQQVAGLPLIHVATPRLTWSRRLLKRAMDIVGSLAALLVLAPVMLMVALAVKAHDRGPVLFRQQRVGLRGETFRMLKFRSMYTDAEERRAALAAANESDGEVLFKIKDDPRVTRPGRILRRYSLDELPQFVNVLRGDMSLVGPRPPLESEVSLYEDHVHRRLRVKPGITGLWQVSGRSDLNWEQAVRLDLYYVENWSVLEDVLILLRTVKAVLAHDGAY